eukprot:5647585-Pyramimonas_sp.AAC.2
MSFALSRQLQIVARTKVVRATDGTDELVISREHLAIIVSSLTRQNADATARQIRHILSPAWMHPCGFRAVQLPSLLANL